MVYQKIEPGVWKPVKDGDAIEGFLLKSEPSKTFKNKVYNVESLDNKQFVVFGTTVLDDKMSYINIGDKIKIVYRGSGKNKKGQDTKIFDVFKDE